MHRVVKKLDINKCTGWKKFPCFTFEFRTYAHTLCELGRRYQLQYRFVNPLESDGNIFIDIRFKKKYMIHRRPLENL